MKMKVYFYTYEYNICRDTGAVSEMDVFITHREPDYDYGEVAGGG